MSDRIAVRFEGGIAQLDDPEVMYRRPNSRQVAEFIGVMNFLPATITGQEAEIAGLGRAALDASQHMTAAGQGVCEVGLRPETLSIL